MSILAEEGYHDSVEDMTEVRGDPPRCIRDAETVALEEDRDGRMDCFERRCLYFKGERTNDKVERIWSL